MDPTEEPVRAGYYPAIKGGLLNDGRYIIIGKLGWGQRSSTWVVRDIKYVSRIVFHYPAKGYQGNREKLSRCKDPHRRCHRTYFRT
jgi:hypothetical protein